MNKKKFKKIIKIASLPVREASGKSGRKKADNYSGKQIHQRKAVDTSGKRSGKFH